MSNQINVARYFISHDHQVEPKSILVMFKSNEPLSRVSKVAAYSINHKSAVISAVECANDLISSGIAPYDDMVLFHDDLINIPRLTTIKDKNEHEYQEDLDDLCEYLAKSADHQEVKLENGAIPISELNSNYFGEDEDLFVITDKAEIAALLESKASATWGCGMEIGSTGWIKLSHHLPAHKGGRTSISVCSLCDMPQQAEASLTDSSPYSLAMKQNFSQD